MKELEDLKREVKLLSEKLEENQALLKRLADEQSITQEQQGRAVRAMATASLRRETETR
jgi:hypothetical protein